MRSIPSDIKAKLLNRFQVDSTDSRPQMSIVSEQPAIASLASEIIHGYTTPNNGDVAVRQLKSSGPDYVYAMCVDTYNAVNKTEIRGRGLSTTSYESSWSLIWDISSLVGQYPLDVAIEFDGNWQLGSGKDYYFMITEKFPWLFWIDNSGTLWTQHWNDTTTLIQLGTGVSSVSAVRAWQSTLTPTDDQGLVVAYIKSGEPYYRAYCLEKSGSKSWETAVHITTFGQTVSSLQVFRTNDYRIGFVSKTPLGDQYILSARQYVGGSVNPEYLTTSPTKVQFGLIPITTQNAYVPSEKLTTQATKVGYFGLINSSLVALSFTATRVSTTQFIVTFNYAIGVNDGTTLESLFTFSPASTVSTVTAMSDKAYEITVSTAIPRTTAVTISISAKLEAWFIIDNQKQPLTAASTSIAGEIITLTGTVPAETLTSQPTTVSFSLVPCTYSYPVTSENLTTQPTTVAFTLTPVGNIPV